VLAHRLAPSFAAVHHYLAAQEAKVPPIQRPEDLIPGPRRRLGLSPAEAGQVIEARDRLGWFAGPEELVAFSELPEAAVVALRDRLLFLAVQ